MEYKAGFHFKDKAGEQNFWRVQASSMSINPSNLEVQKNVIYFDIGDNLVSDQGHDGEDFYYLTDYFYMSTSINPNFLITLYTIDENYYNFHKEADLSDLDGGNPFSEPVIVLSNIEGGLGLFSAFNKRVYTFAIKK